MTSTDAAGKTKTFTSDAFGNLTQVSEPDPAGGAALQTYYTYSMLNQLLQVSMTRGSVTQTRTWVYNTDQRLQSVTHPESGTTSYTYNTDGTVQQKISADNTYVGFTYDGMGRVSTRTDSVAACTTSYYYYYDTPRQAWQVNTVGRLSKVEWDKNVGCSQVGPSGQPLSFAEYYSYTAGGLTVEKDLQVMNGQTTGPSGALFAQYSYDSEARVTGTSYGSSATSITNYFAYDGMGRPQSMSGTSSVTNATYGPSNELLQVSYPFGTETRQYNARLQLTRITLPGQMDLEYRYSATQNNGQITQMKNWVSGEEVNYTYDSLSRLSSAVTTGPEWGLSFSYDGFGNRLSQTPTKGSAPTNTVAVDGANQVIGHSYDARGNTLAMPGLSGLTYDASNRLTSVTGVGDQYSYAPDNRRVYKNGQRKRRVGIQSSTISV